MPIIDGRSVKYSLKNKKILDENLITDGLVCYFNCHGKNTDAHRATLLNLSGVDLNAQLQNFAFNESFGYVGNKIKFDNVDDAIRIDNLGDMATYTVLFKMQIDEEYFTPETWGGSTYIMYSIDSLSRQGYVFYKRGQNNFSQTGIYEGFGGDVITNLPNEQSPSKIAWTVSDSAFLNFYSNGQKQTMTYSSPRINLNLLTIRQTGNNVGFAIEKIFIYNRVLTDTELSYMFNNYL